MKGTGTHARTHPPTHACTHAGTQPRTHPPTHPPTCPRAHARTCPSTLLCDELGGSKRVMTLSIGWKSQISERLGWEQGLCRSETDNTLMIDLKVNREGSETSQKEITALYQSLVLLFVLA